MGLRGEITQKQQQQQQQQQQEERRANHLNHNQHDLKKHNNQQNQRCQKHQQHQKLAKEFSLPHHQKPKNARSGRDDVANVYTIAKTPTTSSALYHKWRTWARIGSQTTLMSLATHTPTPATSKTGATAPAERKSNTTNAKLKCNSSRKSLKQLNWLWLSLLLAVLACVAPTATTTAASAATATATATTFAAVSATAATTHVAAAAAAAAVMAATSTTSANAALVMRATTYEPAFKFQIVDATDEEADPDADGDADVDGDADGDGDGDGTLLEGTEPEVEPNSNEEQLIAYYRQAQQQHDQQQEQQQHSHHQRDAPLLQPLENFDDIMATAGVVSTLNPAELQTKKSATKRGASDAPSPETTPGLTVTATSTLTTAAAVEEKCEPKVLDNLPALPYYDFRDIAEDAARQFTDFLATKFPANPSGTPQQPITEEMLEEVRRRANGIASYALNEDDNLLAFAIAAPSIHTVVVKFRDNVTIPPEQVHNKAFLGSYWRELAYAWNSTEGALEWGSPFRDCNLLKGRWLWPFRVSFTEFKIKIVAAAFIAADEDVCNDGLEEVFGRRHACDRNTTFCLLTENKPAATRDVYTCICRESFYLPNTTLQGFRGDIVEMSEGFDNYSCIPCPGSCSNCDQNGVCLFGEPQEVVSMESLLKVSIGTVLGACVLCCVVLSVIVFRQRKCKAIASGMWTVLETILLGIVLLYVSVAVHFFPASTERCMLEPWLRELGFITCYGAIILKLYRHLVDFRTRKAHRWVLRDVDLLKYLGTMVFAVICYMAAFTASSLDLLETAQLESLREARTNTCHPLKWEYVTQASEVLIVCFGLHLSFASRNANTQFRERQFLVATLLLEFIVSTTFYILRFIYLPEMSPGAIFLALFLRSLLTNTIALGLIFVPKLWYQHKQVRSLAHDLSIRLPVDAFKGSHDVGQRLGGGYAGLCLGDPDIGELTISEMSPEDIRAELKRLYTQLEILKNKTLRQDNPHISKRRGGRKAGHRRFSLQALSAKHRSNKHHQDIEITEAEPSRTPEDSVCSAEGPTDTYAEISGISQSMLSHSVVSHSK